MVVGLEFHSKKHPNLSVDIYAGKAWNDCAGIVWKLSPSGYNKAGLEIGAGVVYTPKQGPENAFFSIEKDIIRPTFSVGFKF